MPEIEVGSLFTPTPTGQEFAVFANLYFNNTFSINESIYGGDSDEVTLAQTIPSLATTFMLIGCTYPELSLELIAKIGIDPNDEYLADIHKSYAQIFRALADGKTLREARDELFAEHAEGNSGDGNEHDKADEGSE